jgi:hypothetical protein
MQQDQRQLGAAKDALAPSFRPAAPAAAMRAVTMAMAMMTVVAMMAVGLRMLAFCRVLVGSAVAVSFMICHG